MLTEEMISLAKESLSFSADKIRNHNYGAHDDETYRMYEKIRREKLDLISQTQQALTEMRRQLKAVKSNG